MALSATWFLLEQEGLLARACLCNGLTALRRANLGANKGLFYSAFFELSTGFERLLKLVLVLDQMARKDAVRLDGKILKHHGHKLLTLFSSTKAICASHNLIALNKFPNDSLQNVILVFLDDFAHPEGRYFNLNNLTDNKHQTKDDPLTAWGKIATQIIQEQATPGEREHTKRNGLIANIVFGDKTSNSIRDLDQQQMDVGEFHVRDSELEIAAKHAIYAMVALIAALRKVINTLCESAWTANPHGNSGVANIPDMKEFFTFAWDDRQYAMRKRRWP
jgi:hypothetical protein